jgi:hypothetical protein
VGLDQRFETADFYFLGWISVFLFVSPGERFQIASFSFVGLDQRQCVGTVKGQASVFSSGSFSVACIFSFRLLANLNDFP